MSQAVAYLSPADGHRLAVVRSPGQSPGLLFLGGFGSDMSGTKALRLEAEARAKGRDFTRFDYAGHGLSSGSLAARTIGGWLDDTLRIIDEVATGPLVLVGSSMGGWLMLLAALLRPARVAGLVGIAAAPDFTADLAHGLPAEARSAIEEEGVWLAPSRYGAPLPITARLIEEGRRHLLLRAPIPIRCPVHLLHGRADPDVPWRRALALAARLESTTVTVELIEDGDHRLSREEDLKRIVAAIDRVIMLATGGLPPA